MAKDLFTDAAEQLAGDPALVAELLREHAATPDGWCRQHGAHRERHPCSIRSLAEMAEHSAAAASTG